MCHEWREQRRERASAEETRRFWDLFHRETAEPPPIEQPVIELSAEDEPDREPAAADR